EEAQRLIPEVDRLLRSAIDAKADYESAERSIQEQNERIMLMGGVVVNRERALEVKTRRESAAAILRNAVESVQQLGCQVTDLDTGLIHFPTSLRGAEVCVCGRQDEHGVAWRHGNEEAFRGRKHLDRDVVRPPT